MEGISDETIMELADMFKVFSDSTRVKIILAILNQEKSVNEISNEVNMNRTTVSHQLKTLRDSKLVKYRKEGTTVYYSLQDNHVEQIIKQLLEHIKEG